MAKKTAPLLPSTAFLLNELGERLKLARLRRKLTARQVSERSGMSLMTLRSLEAGGSGVTMGAYLSVMQVLGLEKDLNMLGAHDEVGRQLQDAQLTRPSATSGKEKPARRTLGEGNSLAASRNLSLLVAESKADYASPTPMAVDTRTLSSLIVKKTDPSLPGNES